jgi:hypothetical protein
MMTQKGFNDWLKKGREFLRNHPVEKYDERQKRLFLYGVYAKERKHEMVIKLAKEEWILSTDGVVKALRYRAKDEQFVARVHY